MENCKFTIIIPNYNNAQWLDGLFESIISQTYDDYEVIFVDDCSTDNSVEIAERWMDTFAETNGIQMLVVKNGKKRYNGGSRNNGLANRTHQDGYILFIDSDDCFSDEKCLESIAETIVANNYPDLVRLSYYFKSCGSARLVDLSSQKTVQDIVSGCDVACWTKCVKGTLIVPFPENTLMEDVVQHIQQLDVVQTIATTDKGIVVWNRDNTNSCSQNAELQGGKWKSSLYRYLADLMDTVVQTPVCKAELEKRIAFTTKNVHTNTFVQ